MTLDIAMLGIVHRATQGDMEPLLERLRNCDLSREEKQFIEDRITNPQRAKIKRGVKSSTENKVRNQEVLIADAWLNYRFKMRAKSDRHLEISKAIGLSEGAVRKILSETRPGLVTNIIIQNVKQMGFIFPPAGETDSDKPLILRAAPISEN